MTEITRRNMLGSAAAVTAAAPLLTAAPLHAAAPAAGTQAPGWYRYKVGSIEVTVATDGANKFKFADDHVSNKKRDEINAALEAAYYEKDMMTTPYNPVAVNTGSKLVVIDTGLGPGMYQQSKGGVGQYHTNLQVAGTVYCERLELDCGTPGKEAAIRIANRGASQRRSVSGDQHRLVFVERDHGVEIVTIEGLSKPDVKVFRRFAHDGTDCRFDAQ